MKLLLPIVIAVLSLAAPRLNAIDLWQYPEAADKNALFAGALAAQLSLSSGTGVFLPEFYLDYILPLGLPFSIGAFLKTPEPNLTSFGLRAGYHINLDDENTDLYALYVFDLGFTRNDILLRYGDQKQDIHYYDFRAGIRRTFGRFFCLSIETGFKLQSIRAGIAIKIF